MKGVGVGKTDSKPSSGSTTDPPPPTSTPGDEDPPMAPKHHSARPGSKLCETSCIQQHYTVQHYWCSSGCATWPAVMPLPAMQYWALWCCSNYKLCDIWRSNVDITAWPMVLGKQELCDMGANQLGAANKDEGMTAPHQARHHWWEETSGEGSGQMGEGHDRRNHSRWKKGLCKDDVSNLHPCFHGQLEIVKTVRDVPPQRGTRHGGHQWGYARAKYRLLFYQQCFIYFTL